MADGPHEPVGHHGGHGKGHQQRADQDHSQDVDEGGMKNQQLVQIRHTHQTPSGLVQRGGDQHPLTAVHLVPALPDQ